MKISQTISETLSFDIPTIKNVDAPFSIGQESRIILEYARAAKLKSYIPASPPPNFKLKLDTHTQVSLQKKGGSSTPCPPWICAWKYGAVWNDLGTDCYEERVNYKSTNWWTWTYLRLGSQSDPCVYVGWKIWGWVWAWHIRRSF